jgi:hypothetical protein
MTIPPSQENVWLIGAGLVLGGVAGLVLGYLAFAYGLPPCVPRTASDPCDAPVYVALGGAMLSSGIGACLGAFVGSRLGRRSS